MKKHAPAHKVPAHGHPISQRQTVERNQSKPSGPSYIHIPHFACEIAWQLDKKHKYKQLRNCVALEKKVKLRQSRETKEKHGKRQREDQELHSDV